MPLLLMAGAPIPFRKRLFMEIGLQGLRLRALFARPPATAPDQILCFLFTRAGDLICATPFLRMVKQQWPDVPLHLVVYRDVETVIRGMPMVDQVTVLDRKKPVEAFRRILSLRTSATTLLLTHNVNPLLAVFLWLCRTTRAAGYVWDRTYSSDAGGFRLQRRNRCVHHLVDQHLLMAEAAGITRPVPPLEWTPDPAQLRAPLAAALAASKGRRRVLMVPGSRSANKVWHWDRFRAVALDLARDHVVIITGAPGEGTWAAEAAAEAPPGAIVDLAGKTNFHEFAELARVCDLVIANDSAAGHLAAVYKTPALIIFGPVDPANVMHRIPDWKGEAVQGTAPCLCGYSPFRENPPCPHGRPCLESLSVDSVLATARRLLRGDQP